MVAGGTSEDHLTLCKQVYHSVDVHGELGVRCYDLKVGDSALQWKLNKKSIFIGCFKIYH